MDVNRSLKLVARAEFNSIDKCPADVSCNGTRASPRRWKTATVFLIRTLHLKLLAANMKINSGTSSSRMLALRKNTLRVTWQHIGDQKLGATYHSEIFPNPQLPLWKNPLSRFHNVPTGHTWRREVSFSVLTNLALAFFGCL